MNSKDFAKLGNFICKGFIEGLKNERIKEMNNKLCGNCVHNTYENGDFLCGNTNSDNYGCYVAYDDSCEDFEEK